MKKYIILIVLLIAVTNLVKAQTRKQDTTGVKMAEKLAISTEHARDVQAAMNHNRDAIHKLLSDKTIPNSEKQEKLSKLIAERRQRIDAITTPDEREKLAAMNSQRPAATLTQREQLIQQTETAMKAKGVKVNDQ